MTTTDSICSWTYEDAAKARTRKEADAFVNKIVAYWMQHEWEKVKDKNIRELDQLARYNIHYVAGYYGNEERNRIIDLYTK